MSTLSCKEKTMSSRAITNSQGSSTAFDCERPQTKPANNQIFDTITLPLDIEQNDDSYEGPRNVKVESARPPSPSVKLTTNNDDDHRSDSQAASQSVIAQSLPKICDENSDSSQPSMVVPSPPMPIALPTENYEDIELHEFIMHPKITEVEEKNPTPERSVSCEFTLDDCNEEGAVGGVGVNDEMSNFAMTDQDNSILLPQLFPEKLLCNETKQPSSIATSLSSRLKPKNMFSNVKTSVDAFKRKADFHRFKKHGYVMVGLQMVPRPSLSQRMVRHEGPLIRFSPGVGEDILNVVQNRKGILREQKFLTFHEQDKKSPKESIPLEYITTLQCVSNIRITDHSTQTYCFEITTSVPKQNGSGGGDNSGTNSLIGSNGNLQLMSSYPDSIMTSGASGNCKRQRVTHLYGVRKENEREIWMQKLLESLTTLIPSRFMCHYYRAGWCYLKTSSASEWSGAWIVLHKVKRRLVFVTEALGIEEKMDLRKACCVVIIASDPSIANLHVEAGPILMIDCPPLKAYMIMSTPRETYLWSDFICEVRQNNGFALYEQQLTKFNVPVIIDKCINFVYIHGCMSEGIYRKSGSEKSVTKLMNAFRDDAYNVVIVRSEYNEHDVANVLKRFMRCLPERLIGKHTQNFIEATLQTEPTEKIAMYKDLLTRLSLIEYETLKRIVGHLEFIVSQAAKNKMNSQNLTLIWGATLMDPTYEEMLYSQQLSNVLDDLIAFNSHLFPTSEEEMKREQAMLDSLQKYYAAAESMIDSVKKSGDIKLWIHLNEHQQDPNNENGFFFVTITPKKTAYEVCRELSHKMHLPTHKITLFEVILNGSLERPLHHDTKMSDIISNWTYLSEDDRKQNYIIAKPIELLIEVQRAIKNLATVTPGKKLKFVDSRTKAFKSLQCELRDNKIVVLRKDKKGMTSIIREIFLHGSTAYLGCEKKRELPMTWALTFVERTQTKMVRSRDAPYIGHVLAGSEWVDRTIWLSSIWYCLYGDNILPPGEIISN